jgi:hypothetical protein
MNAFRDSPLRLLGRWKAVGRSEPHHFLARSPSTVPVHRFYFSPTVIVNGKLAYGTTSGVIE